MDPQWFVTAARQALPGRVQSIVLFGSAAAGDFVEGVSGYDLLVVLDRLGVPELDALAPTIRKWHRDGNPLPLLFTPAQLAASTDAFAIEFLDMQQSREVLHGSDPIKDLKVDASHLRLHLERELKGKLLALRDQYVLAAGRRGKILRLLGDSLSTFLSLFRGALRLYQPEVPAGKLAALQALGKHIPFDPQPFLTVEDLKEQRRRSRDVDAEALFAQYWQSAETVAAAIDARVAEQPPAIGEE